MASQIGFTLPTSRIGPAQGPQMVLLTELECNKIVAKVLGARFRLHPLQYSGSEKESRIDPDGK